MFHNLSDSIMAAIIKYWNDARWNFFSFSCLIVIRYFFTSCWSQTITRSEEESSRGGSPACHRVKNELIILESFAKSHSTPKWPWTAKKTIVRRKLLFRLCSVRAKLLITDRDSNRPTEDQFFSSLYAHASFSAASNESNPLSETISMLNSIRVAHKTHFKWIIN